MSELTPTIPDLNSAEIQTNSTKSNRGGKRPGAGRPRKSNVDLMPSREDQIADIRKKLAENPNARDFAALSRTLGILTGTIKPYARTVAERQQPESTGERPKWLDESWIKTFLFERACNPQWCPWWRYEREMDRFESEWAKSENLTVEQLRERLRREAVDWDT